MTKTAAIIGGGVIGGGWAARFLLNGWDVRVYDPDPEAERKISEVMANARNALPMLYEVAMPAEGRLSFASSIAEAVTGADYVQESVSERIELKDKVNDEITAAVGPDTPICSSTSGYKPSQLQENLQHPTQVMVAHPFNPVYLLPVVELVASPRNPTALVERASKILTSIGMHPVKVRAEIDAHIADRFLEAVWREALWLVKDGVATTQEIDDVIRYGFGLRWAQMGLFETYRVAGGEAGMRHFIAQFGPCLKWPWTKLMDVPELTDELVDKIADQSDAQSGHMSIRELERLRDNNLVAIMRALKGQNAAAGALISEHETGFTPPPDISATPVKSLTRIIPVDWVDYNGHTNESRYGQIYSDAADVVLHGLGVDKTYVDAGLSYFTVDIKIRFLLEAHIGDEIRVETIVMRAEGKKLRLVHTVIRESDGAILSTGDQFLLHVSLETRRTCEPSSELAAKLTKLAADHAKIAAEFEA